MSSNDSSDLLPESPLLVSPTLAATIGLEEALMLQTLADLIKHRPQFKAPGREHEANVATIKWVELSDSILQETFPFWAPVDLRRIQTSLKTLGLLRIEANPADQQSNYFALESMAQHQAATRPVTRLPAKVEAQPGTTTSIPPNWQPDDNWIRLCMQQSIPEAFIHNLVPEFVSYWRDRGTARFSWGNVFYKHVIQEWRREQTRKGAHELASTMSGEWWPSQDALEILTNAGIAADFIEDAVPEFVLYWRERGVVNGAWNTKFIEHIRRQWAKYSASFGHDDTPRIIPEDWQPSNDCFEILQLAEIDENYARSKVPEFVMYWRDSQQVKSSWNTVFLQFIKQDWARQLKQQESQQTFNSLNARTSNPAHYAENQTAAGSNQQGNHDKRKIEERFQRIADRSWAD